MTTTRRKMTVQTLSTLRRIIPIHQFQDINALMRGEEREWFAEKLVELEHVFNTMPKTYEAEDAGGDAIVHLHYFSSGGDWWITERDQEYAQQQAYGLADMGYREMGYIDIVGLIRSPHVELDLHWKPIPVKELLS